MESDRETEIETLKQQQDGKNEDRQKKERKNKIRRTKVCIEMLLDNKVVESIDQQCSCSKSMLLQQPFLVDVV